MSRTVFTLFDDNRRIYQSALPEAGASDMLAYSGVLLEPISVEDVRSARTLWISVGTRDGEVTVTLTYTVGGVQSYTVSPGRPLVLETISVAVDELESIIISPVRRAATVEILVYPGEEDEPPLVPLDAFLVLNAASGYELDDDGRVESWRDIRTNAGAPGLFIKTDLGASLNASNDYYNGQPTINFSSSFDSRLVSEDAPSVFDFLGTGPFTLLAVCSFSDFGTLQHGVSNESATGGGFMMGWDGGYRSLHRTTDDSGDTNNENTIAQELAPRADHSAGKAMVYIIRYDGTAMTVYRQGREETSINVGVSATSVLEALVIGGSPDGGSFGGMGLADLRLYDRRLSDADVNGYISFAKLQYAVEDTESKQAPFGAMYFLRANRGITLDGGDVQLWADTRPEITLGEMVKEANFNAPGHVSNVSALNDRPAVDFRTTSTGLEYNGSPSDFDHLLGVLGPFSVVMVFVSTDTTSGASNMLSGRNNNSIGGLSIQANNADITTIISNTTDNPNIVITMVVRDCIIQDSGRVLFVYARDDSSIPIDGLRTRIRGGGSEETELALATRVPGVSQTIPFRLGSVAGTGSVDWRLAEIRIYPFTFVEPIRDEFMLYVAERYGIADS